MKKFYSLVLALVCAVTMNAADSWSLVGSSINGSSNWDNNNGEAFTDVDGDGVWTLSLTSLSGNFKVLKNKAWAGSYILADYASGAKFSAGQEFELINKDGAGDIYVEDGVTLNDVTLTLTVTTDKVTLKAEAGGTSETKKTYMIVGDFCDWKFENNPVHLLDDDNDGIYEGTIEEISGSASFKLVENSSTWCGGGTVTVGGEGTTINIGGGDNMGFANKDVTYGNLTFTYNSSTNMLTAVAEKEISLDTTWWLNGAFASWTLGSSLQFEKVSDGEFTLSMETLSGEFKVLKNNTWGGSYITTETFAVDTEFTLENRDESGYNIVIASGETWSDVVLTLTVDGDVVKLKGTAGEVSGIESIEADNAAVEYYNLQGLKVENPENGLFICKQGNKVSKVLVK